MWYVYLIALSLGILFIFAVMSVVRELPDALRGKGKLSRSAYLRVLAAVALAVALTFFVGAHRCAGCGNLSASSEYAVNGKIYCEQCYNDVAG